MSFISLSKLCQNYFCIFVFLSTVFNDRGIHWFMILSCTFLLQFSYSTIIHCNWQHSFMNCILNLNLHLQSQLFWTNQLDYRIQYCSWWNGLRKKWRRQQNIRVVLRQMHHGQQDCSVSTRISQSRNRLLQPNHSPLQKLLILQSLFPGSWSHCNYLWVTSFFCWFLRVTELKFHWYR